MSKKKADPEFVPEVIEDDAPELMAALVPSQIEARDNYDPLLIGFPLNILFDGISTGTQSSIRTSTWLFATSLIQKRFGKIPSARKCPMSRNRRTATRYA